MNEKNESKLELPYKPKIAYFSMEIAIDKNIPSYSGGLGILAGDFIKTCADQEIPIIAITLLYRKGFFVQDFDQNGFQIDRPEEFNPSSQLTRIDNRFNFSMLDHKIYLRSWVKFVEGITGFKIPVIFLDTHIKENNEWDQKLSDYLYGGDKRYRIGQEMTLGVGGVSFLKHFDLLEHISKFHMNEGHASLLTLALFHKFKNVDQVKERCVFTTHTPVPAGIDVFDVSLVDEFAHDLIPKELRNDIVEDELLNMTYLGFYFSEYINGVAKRHRKISKDMFPGFNIDFITNGIHLLSWASPSFKSLFDKYILGWKKDNYSLRSSVQIPLNEIWDAHQQEKKKLVNTVNNLTDQLIDEEKFTIGFARRHTSYKRPELLFWNIDELKRINKKYPLQIIYAGKAHPQDDEGKEIIKRILQLSSDLKGEISVVFLKNYSIELAKKLVAGVDLWLNTPKKNLEASGTSGMKAALNGIPQLSVLDGWWLEGHLEHLTGWSIGSQDRSEESNDERDADELYNKLEYVILPLYLKKRDDWIEVMRNSIALNASFFNTQRMLAQYVLNAYFL